MLNLKKTVLVCGSSLAIATMALTGCKTDNSGRSVGRVIDDKMITERVEERLEDHPVYKFSNVDVKTFAGVVQLSGFVNSEQQKQIATGLAQRVEGVARVVNNITLMPETQGLTPTGRTDDLNQPNQTDQNQQN